MPTSLQVQKLQSELKEFEVFFQKLQTDMTRSQVWLQQIQQEMESLSPAPAPEAPELADIHPVRQRLAAEYLSGQGIEIGALHSPLEIPVDAAVQYVDRMPVSELRKQYPELATCDLVQVDIIDDGETLASLPDTSFDFVIANQMIEHCEDPIQTLEQHLRVLKPGGILFMAVPDKRYSFDVDRPLTTIDHLIRDYRQGTRTSRRTHFEEWVRQVDQYPEAEVQQRVDYLLAFDYSIHFHVWTQETFREFLAYCDTDLSFPFVIERVQDNQAEFIVILRKVDKPYLGSARSPVVQQASEFKSTEILSIVNLCHSGERFEQGCIDTPKKRDDLPGSAIAIEGWLVGKLEQPYALRFSVGDRILTEIAIDLPRPDVIKAHSYEPSCRHCGYRAVVDLESVANKGNLLIEAIFADGLAVPAGFIQFRRY
jgi:SAM-dependent methyltransferase